MKTVEDLDHAIDRLDNDLFDVVVTDSVVCETKNKPLREYMDETNESTRYVTLEASGAAEDPVKTSGTNWEEDGNNTAKAHLESINRTLSGLENGKKPEEKTPPFQFFGFVGENEAIRKIASMVKRVSGTDSTVLITGESGTGKELIARAIHRNSPRRHEPMIIINCGSIPSELLESELFGHEKGAFTGAHRTRIGRFELADGGTIFLDEIGDMSPDLQVKLLRVIQEKCFERVGGTKSIQVDVRIISATNKDLKKAIVENAFREDLYYRLNVIPIQVPPLRERKSDIPLLVDYFINKLHEKNRWGLKSFTDEAMAALYSYDWTGNVRELENLMERISVLVDGDRVDVSDLPDYISGVERQAMDTSAVVNDFFGNGMGFNEAVEEHQKRLILHALNKTNWVKAKAAEMLKMKRTTLVEKIKKMNLEPDGGQDGDPGLFD